MQYLYFIFAVMQCVSLAFIHMAAGDTVNYKDKLKRRHPECQQRGFGDFVTFRYYLRCPKANRTTLFLYRLNLCGIGFAILLLLAAIFFAAVPIDFDRYLPGALRYLPFFPVTVFIANLVVSSAASNGPDLGPKYYIRRWVIADILGIAAAAIVYLLLK